MARSAEVERGIEALFEMGILTEENCAKLGNLKELMTSLQGFSAPGTQAKAPARRGRPAREKAGKAGKRGPRGKFTMSKPELKEAYKTRTAKQIAEEHGVSSQTVAVRLKSFEISKTGRKASKPGKKKRTVKKRTVKKRTVKKRTVKKSAVKKRTVKKSAKKKTGKKTKK
jgi:hypothetical protein